MAKPRKLVDFNPNRISIAPNLFRRDANLANVLFHWEGPVFEDTPDRPGIPSYALELILFTQGRALIFEEDGYIFIGYPAANGPLDSIGRMTRAQPITLDGRTHRQVFIRSYVDVAGREHKANAVFVMNNATCYPTMDAIAPIVWRQDYAWGSIGLAEALARARNIIYTDDSDAKKFLKSEINRITDGLDPFIVLYEKSSLTDPSTTDRQAPAVDPKTLGDLWQDYLRCQQAILDELGVPNNPNIDKMERLTSAEALSSEGLTSLKLAAMLEFRQMACEQLDRLFGPGHSCVSYFDHKAVEMTQWYKERGLDYRPEPDDNEIGNDSTEQEGAQNGSHRENDSDSD